jgi:arsenate reductase (glutaredoxin)
MKSIVLYHNPRCSKSRAALALLKEFNITFHVKDYLKVGLSLDEIRELSEKLSLIPLDFIRKNETVFKSLITHDLSVKEQVKLIYENPVLLQRPIVVMGSCAIIARPPEKIHEFIRTSE